MPSRWKFRSDFRCRWRATNPGNVLDRRVRSFISARGDLDDQEHRLNGERKATQRPIADVVHFRRSFASVLRRRWFQFALAALCAFKIYTTVSNTKDLLSLGTETYVLWKLELKFKSNMNSSCHSISLQLLKDGCAIQQFNQTLARNNTMAAHVFAVSDMPITANGFALNLAGPYCSQADIFRFRISASRNGGSTWEGFGSSSLRLTAQGVRLLDYDTPYTDNFPLDSPLPPPPPLSADLRATWPLGLIAVVSPGAVATLCSVTPGLAAVGRLEAARRGAAAIAFAHGAIVMTAGAGFVLLGSARDSLAPFAQWAALWVLSVSVAVVGGRFFGHGLMAFGLISVAGRAVSDCALWDDCRYLAESPPVVGACSFLAGLFVLVVGRVEMRRAVLRVRDSRGKWDVAWREVVAADGAADQLELLQRLCADAAAAASGEEARHRNHAPEEEWAVYGAAGRCWSNLGQGAHSASRHRSETLMQPSPIGETAPAGVSTGGGRPGPVSILESALGHVPLSQDWRTGGALEGGGAGGQNARAGWIDPADTGENSTMLGRAMRYGSSHLRALRSVALSHQEEHNCGTSAAPVRSLTQLYSQVLCWIHIR
jgi:hypothetical protein